MDKNVNELFPINQDLMGADGIRAIFLLREPERSLASILEILAGEGWSEAQALDHYRTRLAQMQAYAGGLKSTQRGFFLTYQQLLDHTSAVLPALQRFLGLAHPLTEQYKKTRTTGMWGWGDTTKRIHAGTIVREKKTTPHALSEKTLEQAWAAYEACCKTLSLHCTTLNEPRETDEERREASEPKTKPDEELPARLV